MIIYKKSFMTIISLTLLSILSILAINYYIDPANQFFLARSFDENIANILLDNKVVMLRSNYNERLFKKVMLAKLSARPDVLVLGSSHVMSIDHDLLNTKSLFNAYVTNPAATLEDDIALYYLYQKRGWKPKTVIIGLDSWILDKKLGWEGWKALLPEYFAGKRLFMKGEEASSYYGNIRSTFEKYSQLLSFDYLKASVQHKPLYLYVDEKKHDRSMAADVLISSNSNECPTCAMIYPDGSRMPAQIYASRSAEEVEELSRKAIKHLDHDNSYTELDPVYMNIFESFISYLLAQHVNVIFYLPPYAPPAYDEMEKDKNYKIMRVSEEYFRSIALKYHLITIGSYNPRLLGLETNNFYDPTHLKKEGFNIVFHQSSPML